MGVTNTERRLHRPEPPHSTYRGSGADHLSAVFRGLIPKGLPQYPTNRGVFHITEEEAHACIGAVALPDVPVRSVPALLISAATEAPGAGRKSILQSDIPFPPQGRTLAPECHTLPTGLFLARTFQKNRAMSDTAEASRSQRPIRDAERTSIFRAVPAKGRVELCLDAQCHGSGHLATGHFIKDTEKSTSDVTPAF